MWLRLTKYGNGMSHLVISNVNMDLEIPVPVMCDDGVDDGVDDRVDDGPSSYKSDTENLVCNVTSP